MHANIFADKIYPELVHDQYFNGYTRIKENHILNTRKLIDAHADEIFNEIIFKIFNYLFIIKKYFFMCVGLNTIYLIL